jgi:hypothetical protein
MKLTFYLLVFNLLNISAIGLSQTERVTVRLTNTSLKELVNWLKSKPNINSYRNDEVED